jgi:signal transduction histidine kinase
MSIAGLVVHEADRLVREFEEFARAERPQAQSLGSEVLQDDIRALLRAIANDLAAPQSPGERTQKSQGHRPDGGHALTEFAHHHAAARLDQGFTLNQMVDEYRALRASINRLVQEHARDATLDEALRLQEAIDQALVEGIRYYDMQIEHGRQLFLAVFGHDLRNPISAAATCAEVLLAGETLGSDATAAAVRIRNSVSRVSRMIEDLLDFTRTGLGTRLPTAPARMDLCAEVAQVVDELRAAHPGRWLEFECGSELWGNWDSQRIAQMLSNLVGNAIQHGDPGFPVLITVGVQAGDVACISIHNKGPAIAAEFRGRIFDPMVRGVVQEAEHRSNRPSIGLGLYISREIARAHGGNIEVDSWPDRGTTFTVKLPRNG